MLILKRSYWRNLNQERSYSREVTEVTFTKNAHSREVTGVTFMKNAHTQEKLLK
jgi:hypothetical protein